VSPLEGVAGGGFQVRVTLGGLDVTFKSCTRLGATVGMTKKKKKHEELEYRL